MAILNFSGLPRTQHLCTALYFGIADRITEYLATITRYIFIWQGF